MPYAIRKLMLSVIALLVAAISQLHADERTDRERATRIQYLIELLASKNQAPQVREEDDGEQTVRFPKEYDPSLQVPVYLALRQLLAEDELAMDLLLAHTDDSRYSFSMNSYRDDNISVSEACEWIAEQKLLAFEPELRVITRSQFGLYPVKSKESLKAWWNKNKNRGLPTLQVEAIDADIKFMADVDGKTALPWHADAERLPIEEFNRHRDSNLKTLMGIRQYIVATGTAYRPKSLDENHSCFFGLPWTGRRYNK